MSLAGTIGGERATAIKWDVIVIGAGPAGSLAAREAAVAGLRTLLVERKSFPRLKVCGACLNGRAVAVLDRVGLVGDLTRLGAAPLQRLEISTAGRRFALSLPGGCSVPRDAFDAMLTRAAIEAGCEFLPRTTATIEPSSGCEPPERRNVRLRVDDGGVDVAVASCVLAADGLAGGSLRKLGEFRTVVSPASRIGLGAVFDDTASGPDPDTIRMAIARSGYAGSVRLKDGRVNVAAAVDAESLEPHGGPGATVQAILSEAGLSVGVDAVDWMATPALTRRRHPVASRRVFVLGDAAGYVEPFTGEGMAWALVAGVSVVPLIREVIGGEPARAVMKWIRTHRRLVRRRQRTCRSVAWLLRRPALLASAGAVLSACPSLVRPLIHQLNAASMRPQSGCP